MPFRPADEILPLTPLSFEILLALLDGERHGYAILRVLQSRLSPTLPMRTGTLYRALQRLLDEGLIEKTGGDRDDERRRYYRITSRGRKIARAEAERLAYQVAAARAHRLLPED
ncbi:MAG TPA: helix-turn-helix transcriptional regulator [Vicinamibacterales bacterium]